MSENFLHLDGWIFIWQKVPKSHKEERNVHGNEQLQIMSKDGISSFAPSLLPDNSSASRHGIRITVVIGA